LQLPEKTMNQHNAHQKIGIESHQCVDIKRRGQSLATVHRRITPAGRPSAMAKIIAQDRQSSVRGNSVKNSSKHRRL